MVQSESPNAMEMVGIDVGGTFTDFVWVTDGLLNVLKVPTTPLNQSEAIEAGMDRAGISVIARVIHGTTVATNALLERRGAKAALITTKGFADVLAIGRQNRPHLYRFSQRRKSPLIPGHLRFEVDERIGANGEIITPLDLDALSGLISVFEAENVESVAIVFLFSFLNPVHEQQVASFIREHLPGITISVSSELLPEYREYERTSTLAINAYVQPLVARYFDRVEQALGDRSIDVMQSNGGVLSLRRASEQAARLVLSGPAGGIVGAFETAKPGLDTEEPHIITFDMGGTSTDVALCPGLLPRTTDTKIDGMPLRFPSMDIHTVGAGGGSIARIDNGGVLRVGPESAGANPGPACYGLGGTEATVTDANVLLGHIPVDAFGATGLKLDKEASFSVLNRLGKAAGISAHEAAAGVIRVANAIMERALRRISVEKGYDPRMYTLVPFGGAGSLHACALAELLGIKSIFIPRYPGVLSAVGLIMANTTFETSQAVLKPIQAFLDQPDELGRIVDELAVVVRQAFHSDYTGLVLRAWLDLRYAGQSYELEVPLELPVSHSSILKIQNQFHAEHARRFGYSMDERILEVVTLRMQGEQLRENPEWSTGAVDVDVPGTDEWCDIWIDGEGFRSVPCINRETLSPGKKLNGPLIVVQYDTTILVNAQWEMSTDVHRNILLWRM